MIIESPSVKSCITFVTAFIDIYSNRDSLKSLEGCFDNFKKLVDTGVPICVFGAKNTRGRIMELIKDTPNIYMGDIDITTMKYSQYIDSCELPPTRNHKKDTKEYMILMNNKIELVSQVISCNPFHTTHFGWIDFSIYHMFPDSPRASRDIISMTQRCYPKTCIYFPGAWSLGYGIERVYNHVIWRYCGSLFMGDGDTIMSLARLCEDTIHKICKEKKILLWEVNIWAIVEHYHKVNFGWYEANHNNSIILCK